MPVPCNCCVVGQGCRLIPPAAATFSGRLTNVAGNRVAGPGPDAFTFTNFGGSGVTVTVNTVGDSLTVQAGAQELDTLAVGVSPPADVTVNVSFSQPVYLRSFGMTDLDDPTEDAYNFQPQIGGLYGQKLFRAGPGCHVVTDFATQNPQGMVHDTVNNGTGGMTWPGTLTSALTFNYGRCASAGLGAFLTELAFDLTPPVYEAVFSCRMPDGDVRWYNAAGVLIPDSEIAPCPTSGPIPGAPLIVNDLVLAGAAFNDAPNEFLCNVVPAPSSTPGFTPTGVCFDPTTGSPSMNWTGVPAASFELEYGSAAGVSGGALVSFSSATYGGLITWPTNLAQMAPGQVRVSNPSGLGHYATLTYVSGPPAASPSGTIRMEGAQTLGLHRTATSIVAPIRFRLDLYA